MLICYNLITHLKFLINYLLYACIAIYLSISFEHDRIYWKFFAYIYIKMYKMDKQKLIIYFILLAQLHSPIPNLLFSFKNNNQGIS